MTAGIKGHVLQLHKASPEIKLLKPKTVTVCDCDDSESGGRFEYPEEIVAYKVAFTSPDGEVALFSISGKSTDIFQCRV